MTGCLPDRTLWELSEGDGTEEERTHLASCILCTRRARRLATELRTIGKVLAGDPPAVPASRRASLAGFALAASIVVAALASLVARPPATRIVPARDTAAVDVERLASAALAADDDDAIDSDGDDDPVGAALAAASPCEWDADGCQDVDQPLF